MKKFSCEKLITPVVALVTIGLCTAFVLSDKKAFSENENRMLATAPSFSGKAVMDKTFMDDVSNYLCDHFPLRDSFMNVKTQFEKLTGHNEINGIYIADDDFYIEPYKTPQNTDNVINTFNKFAAKLEYATPVVMLVPNAVTIYSDKLPSTAVSEDQIAVINEIYDKVNMNTIDVTSSLLANNSEDNLYYRLDHHWTTYGAYIGYEQFCYYKGLKPYDKSAYRVQTVTEQFRGTVFSKINDYSAMPDKIDLFYNDNWKLTVTYSNENEQSDSIYNLKYLEEKDKYSVFLNNLNALVTIENENADTEDEIVVVKDSYANSLVPFLVNHYRKIYVFDTRYYRKPVSSFINENEKVKDVLILYNMNTMDTDLGIKAIY